MPRLEEVGQERIREIEPHAAGIRGLWSPETGIIDFRRVALAMASDLTDAGVVILRGFRVDRLTERHGEVVAANEQGDVNARTAVVCAGLHADELAARSGGGRDPRITPFRGDYYTLTLDARSLVNGLIYPVPDPQFPFLGVHFTKRIDGAVWAGPNAVLAVAREGYRRRDLRPLEPQGEGRDDGRLSR